MTMIPLSDRLQQHNSSTSPPTSSCKLYLTHSCICFLFYQRVSTLKDGAVEVDLWSFEYQNEFREGVKRFSRTWARSLHDHVTAVNTWTEMATTLLHCRLLASQVHNLLSKAERLLGYDFRNPLLHGVHEMDGLLAQLSELHLAWTAWIIQTIGSNVRRTGGGYKMAGFGEAAWWRFHIQTRLRIYRAGGDPTYTPLRVGGGAGGNPNTPLNMHWQRAASSNIPGGPNTSTQHRKAPPRPGHANLASAHHGRPPTAAEVDKQVRESSISARLATPQQPFRPNSGPVPPLERTGSYMRKLNAPFAQSPRERGFTVRPQPRSTPYNNQSDWGRSVSAPIDRKKAGRPSTTPVVYRRPPDAPGSGQPQTMKELDAFLKREASRRIQGYNSP